MRGEQSMVLCGVRLRNDRDREARSAQTQSGATVGTQALKPDVQEVSREDAFEAGWRTAANWMERDDLIADIGSPAYVADRDAALARAQPRSEEQERTAFEAWMSEYLPSVSLARCAPIYGAYSSVSAEWAWSAWLARAQQERAGEVMNLALCEASKLVLRVGQLYRFRPVGDCNECARLALAAQEAYGAQQEKQGC